MMFDHASAGKLPFTLRCHRVAASLRQEGGFSRRTGLPMFVFLHPSRLMNRLRHWLGYRPERRYMRGRPQGPLAG